MSLEFNSWEDVPAELPFRRGDLIIATITGEFNGAFSVDAVARFGS